MTDDRWSGEVRRIASLIKDIDICMLVTRDGQDLRGRPMSNNGEVEFDGDSWFFALRDSAKVRQIEADPSVELAYIATERGAWVSIEGAAQIVTDDARKRALWMEDLRMWFPDGPEDDGVVLLKVQAERLHAWGSDGETVVERGQAARSVAG